MFAPLFQKKERYPENNHPDNVIKINGEVAQLVRASDS